MIAIILAVASAECGSQECGTSLLQLRAQVAQPSTSRNAATEESFNILESLPWVAGIIVTMLLVSCCALGLCSSAFDSPVSYVGHAERQDVFLGAHLTTGEVGGPTSVKKQQQRTLSPHAEDEKTFERSAPHQDAEASKELREQLSALRAQLRERTAAEGRLRQQLADAGAESARLKAELAGGRDQLERLRSTNATLTGRADAAARADDHEELRKAQVREEQLHKTVTELEARLAKTTAGVAASEQMVLSLRAELDGLRRQLAAKPEQREPAPSRPMAGEDGQLEKYWEPYRPHLKKVEELCQWTVQQQHWVNAACAELENLGTAPKGYLSWADGAVRDVVLQYFVGLGHLPALRAPDGAWKALWLEVERDGMAHVPYSMALQFTQKVICAIRDLLTGARVPVEVSKGIWVPQKKTSGTWHQDFADHVPKVKHVLDRWDSPEIDKICVGVFRECDINNDGCLQWNNSEVRHFIARVFAAHGIPLPALSDSQWYQLYRQFDTAEPMHLSQKECVAFAKFMHDEIAKKEVDWQHLGSEAPILVMNSRGTYTALARPHLASASPASAEAAAVAHASDWRAGLGTAHVQRAKEKVSSWRREEAGVHKLFAAADTNRDGHLEWNSSEIRKFVRLVFEEHRLPMPNIPDAVWYEMYREVDPLGSGVDEGKARLLCKNLLERILQLNNAI